MYIIILILIILPPLRPLPPLLLQLLLPPPLLGMYNDLYRTIEATVTRITRGMLPCHISVLVRSATSSGSSGGIMNIPSVTMFDGTRSSGIPLGKSMCVYIYVCVVIILICTIITTTTSITNTNKRKRLSLHHKCIVYH